jgi:ferritin
MIKEKIQIAINEQINKEFFSAYLYLSMSAYCESINLPGFANWFRVQYQEENTHALKLYNYLMERGAKVELKAIDKPKTEWSSPLEVFKDTLEHEKYVTNLINNLYEISLCEKDFATSSFLQWFINEQVEEEATASLILEQVKRVENSNDGLFILDKELATRTFVDSTTKEA